MQALVTANFGNNYIVFYQGAYLQATFKGKTNKAVVGDLVEIDITSTKDGSSNQAIIKSIFPRKNLLYRSDAFKNKAFASNLDTVFFTLAVEPEFNTNLIDRAIIACSIANINLEFILNKIDIKNNLDKALNKLKIYQDLGYKINYLSIFNIGDIHKLFCAYKNKKSLLIGQSGVGKSSIINTLFPNLNLATQNISIKLNAGKHTTTHTKIYPFNEFNIDFDGGYIADSPGFQLFGLNHISASQIEHNFKEFSLPELIGNSSCKFYNCKHYNEPNCAVIKAVNDGKILQSRLDSYHSIMLENNYLE